MKCLVIGGTGIIGNHIIRELLHQGHAVTTLSRGQTPAVNLKDLEVTTLHGDLNSEESLIKAFQGFDWIFNAASYYPANSFGMKQHVRLALKQIQNVITALRNTRPQRYVHTGSLTTIGMVPKGQLADESVAYNLFGKDPHPYFRLKYLVEEELKKAAQDLPIVIVNPTGCFGPYELKTVSQCLIPQLKLRKIPAYFDSLINVVDTADVARGHISAAEKGEIGQRYILGGHNTTTKDLIHEICNVVDVKPPKLRIPISLAVGVATFNETLSLLFGLNPQLPLLGVRFAQYGQFISIDKAKRELDYQVHPMKPCFERAYEWYRQIGYCP